MGLGGGGVLGCVGCVRSLDKFLLKELIVFNFWKTNFKMALIFKRKAIVDILFTLSRQGKFTKIIQHIAYLHKIHVFSSPV